MTNAPASPKIGSPHHLLSVDVDDLLIANAEFYGESTAPGYVSDLEREVAAGLALLHECGVQATFFVNGQYCERHPDLLKEITAGGHVLASHGFRHWSVKTLSLHEFEVDLCRSLEHLSRLQGSVIGYRPPAFSMPYDDEHLRILSRNGIRYVSSGVGVARSNAPRSEVPVAVSQGLLHVPISTAHFLGGRMKYPIGYGVTARLMPERVYLFTLRRWLRTKPFFHLYCHSFELGGLSKTFTIPYWRLPARLSTTIYSSRCRNRHRYLASIFRTVHFRSIEASLFDNPHTRPTIPQLEDRQ